MKTKIECQLSGITEVFQWCKENIGVEGWAWDVTYMNDSTPFITVFEFRRERDATMFALKWLNK